MRILVFNWKDIRNPEAGGAEVFTHEVAKRWVASGDEVTVFCRGFPGAASHDEIDGVRIVRRGGRFSVYREARKWYAREGAGRFDVVIDEINTRPFMTPTFVRDARVVALIHQLAVEVWTEETPFPLSVLGRYVLEPMWLRRYRDVPTITVSQSTESDLRRLGFRDVAVVPEGLSVEPLAAPGPKEETPTLLFVGRLVRTKRPDHALAAHRLLREKLPDVQLWVVGDGYMRRKLERFAAPGVTFFGRVPEEQKHDLMARAHLLLVPGVREGWGLAVLEANAMGTPAVGYRIPGLVDAIRDGEAGMLVEPRPETLVSSAFWLLSTQDQLERAGRGALSFARRFAWKQTSTAMHEAIGTVSINA